jgi:monofunctional biosynthetic peptidoglycan transglycosylase
MPGKRKTTKVLPQPSPPPFDTTTAMNLITERWIGAKKNKQKFSGNPPGLLKKIEGFLKYFGIGIVIAHCVFLSSVACILLMFKTIEPGATTLMLYRKFIYGWKIQAPQYVSLSKIPSSIKNMTIRVEDGNFYQHHGIIFSAMKNAWQLNQQFGSPIYGGSTITMQTARTIFLVPEKWYIRKYLEVLIALEMELILGKDRILELYFNYAEWGKGVFGIQAASYYHFKKSVTKLNIEQAIEMVTFLSSPIRYGPSNFLENGILRSRYQYLQQRFSN